MHKTKTTSRDHICLFGTAHWLCRSFRSALPCVACTGFLSTLFCGVQVDTDHKPLQVIFQKSFHKTPHTPQRSLRTIEPYPFEIMHHEDISQNTPLTSKIATSITTLSVGGNVPQRHFANHRSDNKECYQYHDCISWRKCATKTFHKTPLRQQRLPPVLQHYR